MKELEPFFPETGEGLGGGYGMFPGGGGASYPAPGYNPFGPSDWELNRMVVGPTDEVPPWEDVGSVSYGPGLDFEFDPEQLMTRDMPVFDFEEPSTFDFTGD